MQNRSGEKRTSNIRRHQAVHDAGALQQGHLGIWVDHWLKWPHTEAWRQGYISTAGVGVDEEDVRVTHLLRSSLAETYPSFRRRTLDLEEEVTATTGSRHFGHVDRITQILCWTFSDDLRVCRQRCCSTRPMLAFSLPFDRTENTAYRR